MSDLFFIGQPEIDTIEKLWAEGLPRCDIASAVGIRTRQLESLKAKGVINVANHVRAEVVDRLVRPPSSLRDQTSVPRSARKMDSSKRKSFAVLARGTVSTEFVLKKTGERFGRCHYEKTKLHPMKGRLT